LGKLSAKIIPLLIAKKLSLKCGRNMDEQMNRTQPLLLGYPAFGDVYIFH